MIYCQSELFLWEMKRSEDQWLHALDNEVVRTRSIPKVPPIQADSVGDGDTGVVRESSPRVLDSKEEDEKDEVETENGWNAHCDHDNFDDFEDIGAFLVDFFQNAPHVLVRDDYPTEEQAKDEPSDVGNVVDEGKEADY